MKKTILSILTLVSIAFLSTSCGVMGVTSTPSHYEQAGKEVSTVKTHMNILALTPMDSHKETAEMLEELKGKCTNGEITNIRSTYSYKNIWIINSEKIEMSGNCK